MYLIFKKIKEPGVGPKVIKTSCHLTYLTSPNQTILRPRVDVLQAYGLSLFDASNQAQVYVGRNLTSNLLYS